MTKNDKEKVSIYNINNKKYTIVTQCTENAENIEKLYDVICKYVISQINLL